MKYKNVSSLPPMKTPKSHLTAEQPTTKKSRNLPNRYPIPRDEQTTIDGRKGVIMVKSNPITTG